MRRVPPPSAPKHVGTDDDVAVDRFSNAMKNKLAAKRLEGRGGWQDKDPLHGITGDELSRMLREHVEKGDPVDVANFCMMLHHRGEPITGRAPYESHGAARLRIDQIKAHLATSRDRAREAYIGTSMVLDAENLIEDIVHELIKARAKFPGKNVTFAAMIEEVGELSTALFEESRQRVREEAIQVAVMAMRVVLDGDHTFNEWRQTHDLDSLVPYGEPDMNRRYHVSRGNGRPVVATFNDYNEAHLYIKGTGAPAKYICLDTRYAAPDYRDDTVR